MRRYRSHLELFRASVSGADGFPKNLVFPNEYTYQLDHYCDLQDEFGQRLYCEPKKTAVEVVDIRQNTGVCKPRTIKTHLDLENVGIQSAATEPDPTGRYIFISAPNSRAPLNIDRLLLDKVLSYYQVMPEFLDLLYTFGLSERPKEFHFSGFRSEINFGDNENKLCLPELGRSGRDIRMSYMLQSPESLEAKTSGQKKWPWSVRQCAVYHSFDLETEKTIWIVVKANKKIRDRVYDLCEDEEIADVESTKRQAFEAALLTHLVICAWASESWRWYIIFLEKKTQDLTRSVLTKPPDAPIRMKSFPVQRATSTAPEDAENLSHQTEPQPSLTVSPEDLLDLHEVDERVNAALLVLRANAAVLRDLRDCYGNAAEDMQKQATRIASTPSTIGLFTRRLNASLKDLDLQEDKLKSLSRLLTDRRSLLESLLQWQNGHNSLTLADKAQVSAENMIRMTYAMHAIAQTTKLETVSMRIITLVTLVYLPGTFVSTLMSTPIVTFQPPETMRLERRINGSALALFLELSLPLLLGTLIAWFVFFQRANRRIRMEDAVRASDG